MKIVRYSPEMKGVWDDFVETSKNGTFLLKRDYMEYHADRFPDHSYLFLTTTALSPLFFRPHCVKAMCFQVMRG